MDWGGLAVMSAETYEMMLGKTDLYKEIEEGLLDLEKNGKIDSSVVFSSLKEKYLV